MADPTRARKLSDRIKVVVAEALEKRVKDPRLGFITITDARVTNDLQHATLYYTVLGDDEERAATAAALESAKGVLRAEVGRRTGVRLTPTLTFSADVVPETAAHIEDLLRVASEQDARVAALAATARPAGDADPYRKPAEDEDLGDEEVDEDEDDAADDLDDDFRADSGAVDEDSDEASEEELEQDYVDGDGPASGHS
ncbi:ribosome-binding factor A [Kineococcus xinjiangensis]|uniref:Ribosome-binding factor A n=1 Tax=Kineococcus xinjiangensis TaxID=512762 RepID=A0A2S6IVV2_9ACTN|nr:30S ribosome-binding factor RbfA [Kineococcus xinjiangensis]PPK98492.1 ribosome-binding factor A [Kineococcus xinjiangensis]